MKKKRKNEKKRKRNLFLRAICVYFQVAILTQVLDVGIRGQGRSAKGGVNKRKAR